MRVSVETRLARTYREGKAARERGDGRDTNPNVGDDRFVRAWFEGFDVRDRELAAR